MLFIHPFDTLGCRPVVVFGAWNDEKNAGVVGFMTCREQTDRAQQMLPRLAPELRKASRNLLKKDPRNHFNNIVGGVAYSFLAIAVTCARSCDKHPLPQYTHPEFIGMWAPSKDGRTETTLLWYHPDEGGYQVETVFSVPQYERVVRTLEWVNDDAKAQLEICHERVHEREKRGQWAESFRLTGPAARVICLGTIFYQAKCDGA